MPLDCDTCVTAERQHWSAARQGVHARHGGRWRGSKAMSRAACILHQLPQGLGLLRTLEDHGALGVHVRRKAVDVRGPVRQRGQHGGALVPMGTPARPQRTLLKGMPAFTYPSSQACSGDVHACWQHTLRQRSRCPGMPVWQNAHLLWSLSGQALMHTADSMRTGALGLSKADPAWWCPSRTGVLGAQRWTSLTSLCSNIVKATCRP